MKITFSFLIKLKLLFQMDFQHVLTMTFFFSFFLLVITLRMAKGLQILL